MSIFLSWSLVYLLVHAAVIVRALAVDGKEPASRAAWVVVLVFLPALGIVLYLLFGEPWVALRSRRRGEAASLVLGALVQARLPANAAMAGTPERFQAAFRICERLAGCPVAAGNSAELAADSNDSIVRMVRDFDAAGASIHVSFYIWLADHNGLAVVAALVRAAQRGVACRVIADGVGSRALIRSRHWGQMREAGVRLCASMKPWRGLVWAGNRIDLRNHRKIVVVDGRITYCGSQNCADPEFRVKPRFAPWVDVMLRFEGPVALHNQLLFATDWTTETDEDMTAFMRLPPAAASPGFPAVAFGTGPTSPAGGMSSVFVSLLYAAHTEVVISNPYFVPDPQLLAALVSCGERGVATSLILPRRNDSAVVGAISKAYYAQLARAGVRLYEFSGGLLHAKTLVADRVVALIGSANMDRRSLDLNFENNLLLHSAEVVAALRARQQEWLEQSVAVDAKAVHQRSIVRRLADNVATVIGPLM